MVIENMDACEILKLRFLGQATQNFYRLETIFTVSPLVFMSWCLTDGEFQGRTLAFTPAPQTPPHRN